MSKHQKHRKQQSVQPAPPSKLPTSREVYHRIRWDSRLTPASFVIGVEERFSGMIEVPFHAFVPDGEIPWHRVWYFKQGDQIMWDREKRIDLIVDNSRNLPTSQHTPSQDNTTSQTSTTPVNPEKTSSSSVTSHNATESTGRSEVATTARMQTPVFSMQQAGVSVSMPGDVHTPAIKPQPMYRYDAEHNRWMAIEEQETVSLPVLPSSIRVANWNVLFDWYDADKIYSESRWLALRETLLSCEADIIGLQEMTDGCLALLLEHPEIRQQFFVSEIPGGSSIQPYGQVILSRYPLRCATVFFSFGKKAMVAEILGQTETLGVAVVHLSSNREAYAAQQRICQIRELMACFQAPLFDVVPTWLVMGDFNCRQGDPLESLWPEYGFIEVWPFLHPDLAGDTFVPQANPLAKLNSRSGEPGRLDRMYLCSSQQKWRPHAIEYLGQEPYTQIPEPRYCSDHAGVFCVLECQQDQQRFHVEHGALSPQQKDTLRQLEQLCGGIVASYGESVSALSGLYPYGSFALGAMIPGSDIDIVWVVPDILHPSELLLQLQEQLKQKGVSQRSRYREHAAHPILDLMFDHGDIELSCLGMPADFLPFSYTQIMPEETLSEHEMSRWRGLYDAYMIQTHMNECGLASVYPQVLQRIKTWATRRAISGKAYGYLGGIDWSILVAWSCREASRQGVVLSVNNLVADFFARCVSWKGEYPIALQEPTPSVKKHPRRDKVMILSPSENPVKNVAHTLLDGTWAVTYREFCRTHRMFQQDGISESTWAAILSPAQPDPASDSLCLLLSQPDEHSLDVLVGMEKGTLLQNLIRWETESGRDWFRPYPPFVIRQQGDRWCASLYLERLPRQP